MSIIINRLLRNDLILIVGEDALSLFDYFQVDELHSLNRKDCIERIDSGRRYIDGMCNLIPGSDNKHYIFINNKALSEYRYENFGLIFHEAMHYSFEKYWNTLQQDEERLITEAEDLAIEICILLF